MAPSDGLGTHTPIRFGPAIERARGFHLREFNLEEPITNERCLLYPFTKRLGDYWWGWVLVQAARRAGRFTIEVGLSLHKRYPLHNGRVRPVLAVDGVRERAACLDNKEDQWWEYRTQAELETKLREATDKAAKSGLKYLYDAYAPELIKESMHGQELLNRWEVEEQKYGGRLLGARFSEWMAEPRAYEYLSTVVYDPRMRAVVGPMLPMLALPSRLSAMVYVMAGLLETMDPAVSAQNIYVPAVKDDETTTMVGRAPFYEYLDMAQSYDERVNRVCFFKALDIVEAQFDKEDRLHLTTGVITRPSFT